MTGYLCANLLLSFLLQRGEEGGVKGRRGEEGKEEGSEE